jgi:hypothetical protein
MSPSDSLTPPPPSDAVRPPPIHDSSPRIPRLQINAPMMELDEGGLGAEEDEAEGEDEPEIYETVRVDDGDVLQQGLSGEEQPVGEEMLEEEADAEEEELADGEDINGDAEQEADEEEPGENLISLSALTSRLARYLADATRRTLTLLARTPAGTCCHAESPDARAQICGLAGPTVCGADGGGCCGGGDGSQGCVEAWMLNSRLTIRPAATHPALVHLHKILSQRRERLHEVASRRHQAALAELVKAREADKQHVWTWWTVRAICELIST